MKIFIFFFKGLEPDIFWKNKDFLLEDNEFTEQNSQIILEKEKEQKLKSISGSDNVTIEIVQTKNENATLREKITGNSASNFFPIGNTNMAVGCSLEGK